MDGSPSRPNLKVEPTEPSAAPATGPSDAMVDVKPDPLPDHTDPPSTPDPMETPTKQKPVIEPIVYDLEPSPTADSTLKARVVEERQKQLHRMVRFSSSTSSHVDDDNDNNNPTPVSSVTEASILGARRAAVRRGFATGFDTNSPEEIAKRQARFARFGPPQSHPFYKPGNDHDARAARAARFGADAVNDAAALSAPSPLETRRNVRKGELLRHNTIHLYGVDRMRTTDVVNHFTEYGPSWCEWLNDSSCNLAFEDAFTLRRALRGMSITSSPTATPSQSMDALVGHNNKNSTISVSIQPSSLIGNTSTVTFNSPADSQPQQPPRTSPQDDIDMHMSDGNELHDTTWRPMRPFIRKGNVVPLWGRVATEYDIRPGKPNPNSKWSRTIQRKIRLENEPDDSGSEPSTPRKTDSSTRLSLGVSKDQKGSISKNLARKSSKMDIDSLQ